MLYYEIAIDARKCDGCGKCVAACPAHVLAFDNGTAVVNRDPDECMGCQLCVEACPLGCLDVRPRVVHPEKSLC